MTDYVERLVPLHLPRPQWGGGAPRGCGPEADKQRDELQEHLERAFLVDPDRSKAEVETLTIVERTMMELEMRDRSKTTHSFEYDPL